MLSALAPGQRPRLADAELDTRDETKPVVKHGRMVLGIGLDLPSRGVAMTVRAIRGFLAPICQWCWIPASKVSQEAQVGQLQCPKV